jgi:sulfur transfer complex TusBCD TusB component (DsrH family)
VCLEAKQAEVIRAALNRFELLKQAYAEKSGAYQGLLVGHEQDSLLLASNGRLIAWYKESYAQEQGLRQDATAKLYVRQRQATRRGLLAGIEALTLILLTYALITN